jgi:hypothetical protein
MKAKPIFAWYDFWVGMFYDKKKRLLYFFSGTYVWGKGRDQKEAKGRGRLSIVYMRILEDKAWTLMQLLANAAGVEYEDQQLAAELIEEVMKQVAKDEFLGEVPKKGKGLAALLPDVDRVK